jgi:hypothetical protein
MAGSWSTIFFTAAVVAVLVAGWRQRNDYNLSAESGLGYYLGIIGGVLMLLLLVYPLKKRVRWMRGLGSTQQWFQLHMVFGVVGPVAIMFHSNFRLGSMNSTSALFAMLAVAFSGLVGRYLYSGIHRGLYGRRSELAELTLASADARKSVAYLFHIAPEFKQQLEQYERVTAAASSGLVGSILKLLAAGASSRKIQRKCLKLLRPALAREARKRAWTRKVHRDVYRGARRHLTRYLDAVRRVVEFECFVKLFGLWHVLHMPMFIILVVTSLVHVYAVHMY